jgi:hypothetical protein
MPSDAHRTPAPSRLRVAIRESALSLVLFALFLGTAAAQIAAGLAAYNNEREERGQAAIELGAYLTSGHFLEAFFENWESEFLQMGLFVVLSCKLVQKGSAESKPIDEPFEGDEDPRRHRHDPDAPWPVRRGGWILWLYERSLAVTFAALFAFSFLMHAIGGQLHENEQRALMGDAPLSLLEFVASSQFWYESLQNWQSEFVAVLAIVVLTIFLRQRGSPQSKPVAESHQTTGV